MGVCRPLECHHVPIHFPVHLWPSLAPTLSFWLQGVVTKTFSGTQLHVVPQNIFVNEILCVCNLENSDLEKRNCLFRLLSVGLLFFFGRWCLPSPVSAVWKLLIKSKTVTLTPCITSGSLLVFVILDTCFHIGTNVLQGCLFSSSNDN